MSKNKSEYQERCDDCKSTGSPTHARVFYMKINNVWMHLCSVCWEAHRSPQTGIAKPKNTISVEAMELHYNGNRSRK